MEHDESNLQVIPEATPAPIERLSEAEVRFERARKKAGLVFAPVLFVGLLLIPMPTLKPEAHRLAAITASVILLWITEALPMPITALLGAAMCVLLRVAPAREVFAPFADQLMFLFIGSFIIARGIFIHGLDRRLAFAVLSIRWVGASPARILIAFGAVTAFMSAWISNTATTAMMFAIGMSILAVLFENARRGGSPISQRYATALMLMTSFSASIGGLATPVGTPPNIIGLKYIQDHLGVSFPFFKWCLVGVPVVVVLYLWLAAYLNVLGRAGTDRIRGADEVLRQAKRGLGRMTTAERSTLAAFGVAVALWVIPGGVALAVGESSPTYRAIHAAVPEGVAAILGAFLLFLLPGNKAGEKAMTWEQATRIDWGVVMIYGGGYALGVLSFNTGLAEAVGTSLTRVVPTTTPTGMLIAACLIAVIVSETTSNTASANMVVPVVIALAQKAGVDPLEPALGATLAASLGFMLPVSTPCNAIVYGSGYVPITRMVKYGLLLDVVGIIVVVVMVKLLVPALR